MDWGRYDFGLHVNLAKGVDGEVYPYNRFLGVRPYT
jgi:hypothetical protein